MVDTGGVRRIRKRKDFYFFEVLLLSGEVIISGFSVRCGRDHSFSQKT